MTVHARTLIERELEAGHTVVLDEFEVETVAVDRDRECGACGSSYRRTHGGYGSVCFDCGEPWFDGRFIDDPEDDGDEHDGDGDGRR